MPGNLPSPHTTGSEDSGYWVLLRGQKCKRVIPYGKQEEECIGSQKNGVGGTLCKATIHYL